MRIHVDKDRCVGSGQCALTAPDVFDQDDTSGVVLLRTDSPAPGRNAHIRAAASVCPVVAITLTE